MGIISLWTRIRNKYCPRRIYQYGKLGLSVFDDRTRLERLCDTVDYYLSKFEKESARPSIRQVWHSFFDTSTGQVISSYAQIRDIERQGKTYCTFDEMERECKKQKSYVKDNLHKTQRKNLEKKVREVFQGKSFLTEIRKNRQKYQ